MLAMSEMFSLQTRLPSNMSQSKSYVKDCDTVWEVRRVETADRPMKTIFIVCPKWFDARQIALTILAADRHQLAVIKCGKYINHEYLVERGHEVYVAQYGPETRFIGAVKLEM